MKGSLFPLKIACLNSLFSIQRNFSKHFNIHAKSYPLDIDSLGEEAISRTFSCTACSPLANSRGCMSPHASGIGKSESRCENIAVYTIPCADVHGVPLGKHRLELLFYSRTPADLADRFLFCAEPSFFSPGQLPHASFMRLFIGRYCTQILAILSSLFRANELWLVLVN